MFTKEFIFVEHSKGDFDGTVYDNVLLSDGITTGKFKNLTGQGKLNYERGQKVEADFEVEFGKNNAVKLSLKDIREI